MQALEASGRPWTLNKGEGAFYGPKLRICLARRHRPRLAMRHCAGRSQPARPAWCVLYRRTLQQSDAGDASPRHVRLARTLYRHSDRAFRRAFPAVVVAPTGRRRHDHIRRRRLCPRKLLRRRTRGVCGPKPTSATKRSTTKCVQRASTRWRKCRRFWWSARKGPPSAAVSIRRLGSEGQSRDAARCGTVDSG